MSRSLGAFTQASHDFVETSQRMSTLARPLRWTSPRISPRLVRFAGPAQGFLPDLSASLDQPKDFKLPQLWL